MAGVAVLGLCVQLEAVPDPQAPTRGLAWTLGETSLHLAGGPGRYADFARGRALPEPTIDLGPVSRQRMAAESERAPFHGDRDPLALAGVLVLVIVGLRPGEKLREELFDEGEELLAQRAEEPLAASA